MKTKITWISMEELKPPRDWALPFTADFNGKQYKITGADYIDRVWKAQEVEGESQKV